MTLCPTNDADDRAERQERAERDGGLAALRSTPLRATIAAPTSTPASSANKIAGTTARPRNRPITPASLTSPMPMPPG